MLPGYVHGDTLENVPGTPSMEWKSCGNDCQKGHLNKKDQCLQDTPCGLEAKGWDASQSGIRNQTDSVESGGWNVIGTNMFDIPSIFWLLFGGNMTATLVHRRPISDTADDLRLEPVLESELMQCVGDPKGAGGWLCAMIHSNS